MRRRGPAVTGARAALGHRPFRYLAAARAISMLGNAVAPVALAFAVLDLTGSVAALGIVVGARSATNVAFLLFGGVLADRLPRQVVLVGSCALSAVTQAAVATLVLTDAATVPLLAVLSALNGAASAPWWPASAALLPQTVPAALLRPANAVLRLGMNAAMILGASLGGLLVAAVGPGWGLAVDAATFALAGALFARISVSARAAREGTTPSVLADLREGWTEFIARTWVWVVVASFAFLNAATVATIAVLGPVIADGTIGRGAWGLVLAAQTAGYLAGGLLSLRVRARRLLLAGCSCMALEALMPLTLAVDPTLPLLAGAAFLGGMAIEQFVVAWDTSLQEHVPGERLARVSSYDALGSFVAIPIAEVAVGPLAERFGTDATLIGGAAIIAAATLTMVASRSVRTLAHHPAPAPV